MQQTLACTGSCDHMLQTLMGTSEFEIEKKRSKKRVLVFNMSPLLTRDNK